MKAGTIVKMTSAYKETQIRLGGVQHVKEFGSCVGVVLGPTDYGSQKGPELDVRWAPSGLRYAYAENDLEETSGAVGIVLGTRNDRVKERLWAVENLSAKMLQELNRTYNIRLSTVENELARATAIGTLGSALATSWAEESALWAELEQEPESQLRDTIRGVIDETMPRSLGAGMLPSEFKAALMRLIETIVDGELVGDGGN